jgi:hypothetical protein
MLKRMAYSTLYASSSSLQAGHGETGIGTQADAHLGESGTEALEHGLEKGPHPVVPDTVAASQSGAQKRGRVGHTAARMIHRLPIVAVKHTPLLTTVRKIIRRIKVQKDFSTCME